MMIYFGSRERTVEDWRYLLSEVHPQFEIQGSKAATGQANVVIDVIWKRPTGEDSQPFADSCFYG